MAAMFMGFLQTMTRNGRKAKVMRRLERFQR
jgi:hypothetical protein